MMKSPFVVLLFALFGVPARSQQVAPADLRAAIIELKQAIVRADAAVLASMLSDDVTCGLENFDKPPIVLLRPQITPQKLRRRAVVADSPQCLSRTRPAATLRGGEFNIDFATQAGVPIWYP